MKRTLIFVVLFTMIFSAFAGCAPKAADEAPVVDAVQPEEAATEVEEVKELEVLKVSVMPALNSVPIKYMIDNGVDVAHGFKLETVTFPNGGIMNEAFASGEVECGVASAAAVNTLAIYGGYCLAEIGACEGGCGTFVLEDSPIAAVKGYNPSYPDVYGSPETLKGAVIATVTGSISHLNVIKWLEKLGMTQEDVEIVNMEYPQAFQALKTGNCDVAAVNPPTYFEAIATEGVVETSNLTNLDVPQFDCILASKETYDTRKDLLVRYIEAFYEATDALRADTDMAAQVLKDWYAENGTEFTIEECKREVELRPFVTSEEALSRQIGDCIQVTGQFWISQGLLEESKYPEIATHIDDSLMKDALA